MVPLSLRERVGVRGCRRGLRTAEAGVFPGSPHPVPLPEGEGDSQIAHRVALRKPLIFRIFPLARRQSFRVESAHYAGSQRIIGLAMLGCLALGLRVWTVAGDTPDRTHPPVVSMAAGTIPAGDCISTHRRRDPQDRSASPMPARRRHGLRPGVARLVAPAGRAERRLGRPPSDWPSIRATSTTSSSFRWDSGPRRRWSRCWRWLACRSGGPFTARRSSRDAWRRRSAGPG